MPDRSAGRHGLWYKSRMCELCLKHGDGQVWYRNARNYAQDLLADVRRRRFIEDFYRTTMTEGIVALGRLETIHRRKGRLPQKLVNAIVEQARDEHFGQVVTLDDVREIVGAAAQVVRLPCACRWVAERTEARSCYSLSYSADPWFKGLDPASFGAPPTAGLETVTREEAVSQMAALEEGGAVHTIWTMVTPFIGAICNCTPQQCLGLRNLALGLDTLSPGERPPRWIPSPVPAAASAWSAATSARSRFQTATAPSRRTSTRLAATAAPCAPTPARNRR